MQALTQNDIDRYRSDIQRNGVQGVIRTYSDLLAKGYDYAGWAKGVAEAEGITLSSLPKGAVTGRAAVMFMKDSSGQHFTPEKINRIRVDMAEGYLQFLQGNLGKVPRDVSFREVRDFHRDVFRENGLTIDNWTLETPMKLIGKYEGEAVQERMWASLRRTQGTGMDALMASAALYDAMQDYAKGYIVFDRRDERIPNNVAHLLTERGADQVMGEVFTQRRIEAQDRQAAGKWLKDVSIVLPLLRAEEQQGQTGPHYAGNRIPEVFPSSSPDDLFAQTNKLLAGLRAGDSGALARFCDDNREQLHELSCESVRQAEVLNKLEQSMLAQAAPQPEQEVQAVRHRGMSL